MISFGIACQIERSIPLETSHLFHGGQVLFMHKLQKMQLFGHTLQLLELKEIHMVK